MTMLIWNGEDESYQATVGSDLVEVDGDAYSEAVRDLTKEYVREGMDEEAARDKAEDELLVAEGWTGNSPMSGVKINGISQE